MTVKLPTIVARAMTLLVAGAGVAADAPTILAASEIAAREAALLAKKSAAGEAGEIVQQAANHWLLLMVCVRTGEAELHENWSDEIVVRSVRIRLIIGGELLGKHPFGTMPGEFHGSGVAGKQSFDPGPGDVIDIPANIPHWMQVVGKDPAKVLIYKG